MSHLYFNEESDYFGENTRDNEVFEDNKGLGFENTCSVSGK